MWALSLVKWAEYTSMIGWQKSNEFMSLPVCRYKVEPIYSTCSPTIRNLCKELSILIWQFSLNWRLLGWWAMTKFRFMKMVYEKFFTWSPVLFRVFGTLLMTTEMPWIYPPSSTWIKLWEWLFMGTCIVKL